MEFYIPNPDLLAIVCSFLPHTDNAKLAYIFRCPELGVINHPVVLKMVKASREFKIKPKYGNSDDPETVCREFTRLPFGDERVATLMFGDTTRLYSGIFPVEFGDSYSKFCSELCESEYKRQIELPKRDVDSCLEFMKTCDVDRILYIGTEDWKMPLLVLALPLHMLDKVKSLRLPYMRELCLTGRITQQVMEFISKSQFQTLELDAEPKQTVIVPPNIKEIRAINNLKKFKIEHKLDSVSLTEPVLDKKINTRNLRLFYDKYRPIINLENKLPDLEKLMIECAPSTSGNPALVKLGDIKCDMLSAICVLCEVGPKSEISRFAICRTDKKPINFSNFKMKTLYLNFVCEEDIIPELDELVITYFDPGLKLPVIKCKILSSVGPIRIKPGSQISILTSYNAYKYS